MKTQKEDDEKVSPPDTDNIKSKIWDAIIDKLRAEGYVTSPDDSE